MGNGPPASLRELLLPKLQTQDQHSAGGPLGALGGVSALTASPWPWQSMPSAGVPTGTSQPCILGTAFAASGQLLPGAGNTVPENPVSTSRFLSPLLGSEYLG